MGRLLRNSFMFFVYIMLYLPMGLLIINSFNQARFGIHWQGFSLEWYQSLLTNSTLINAAQHSLMLAFFASSFASLLGFIMAVSLYRYQFYSKRFVLNMLFISMLTPDIVMAISLLILFIFIGLPLGFWTLLCSHITFCLPFVVGTIYSRLRGVDTKILEAAKDLGANEWVILYRILLPLAFPALVSGWLLSFTLSMDDVIISSFVTGSTYQTLPLWLYSIVKVGASPDVNAVATILFCISLLLVLSSQFLVSDQFSFKKKSEVL